MTFGQEYMEYSKTNVLVDMCKSVLKLSCNAPGLSKQKYDPEIKDKYLLKYLQEHNLVKRETHFLKRNLYNNLLQLDELKCYLLKDLQFIK